MLAIISVIFVMLLIGFWQGGRLLNNKRSKELIIFMGMWLISTTYAIIVIADIAFISPMEIITTTISKLWRLFYNVI